MSKWFPLIILKSIHHKVFIFHTVIGHNENMTPIDFAVTRLKVKLTGTFNVEMVSTDCLEN
jgi:hypothetical protein